MENKLARIMRATGPLRFLLPLGIALIVLGIITSSFMSGDAAETVGTVTASEPYIETDSEGDETTCYEIFFTYEVDGKSYENSFSGYDEPIAAGETIPVYYDSQNPGSVSNMKNTRLVGMGMTAAGVLAIAVSAAFTLKAFRKQRDLDRKIAETSGGAVPAEVEPLPKEQLTEYYVSFDGVTLKPGYIVEDRDRNVIYRGTMTKNALVGNRIFTFTDCRSGLSEEHEVGHTVTSSYSNEFFSTSSTFRFDGKDIWDVLHEKGIRISTDLHSKFPKAIYTVSLNGRFLATVETSSQYVHEEDEEQHKIKVPYGRYYYRCWTASDSLDLLFLTVFAISETEQAVVE